MFWSTLKTFKAPFYRIFWFVQQRQSPLCQCLYEVRSTAPTAPFSRAMGGHSIGVRKLLLGKHGEPKLRHYRFSEMFPAAGQKPPKTKCFEASRRCLTCLMLHSDMQICNWIQWPFYRGPIFVSTRVMPFYGRPTFVSTCVVPFYRQPCCRSWGWSPSWQSQGNHPWRGGRTAR